MVIKEVVAMRDLTVVVSTSKKIPNNVNVVV